MEQIPSRAEAILIEPVTFKPGGPLENMGELKARFSDVEVHIIASPDDPKTAFITGLKGRDVASVIDEMARAIKDAGFDSIDYRPDNEDGRAAARVRLFDSFRKRIEASGLTVVGKSNI